MKLFNFFKKKADKDYPKMLLTDIYWSFDNGKYSDIQSFSADFAKYYKEIAEQDFPLGLKENAFNYPKIVIQYMKYNIEEEDHDEPQQLFIADNSEYFTIEELLYKLNKTMAKNLDEEYDAIYFEGLHFSTINDPDYIDIPVYCVIQGS